MKFAFFVKNGEALLDGNLEEPVDTAALTTQFTSNGLSNYMIKSTAQLTSARNLRKSFKLYIRGLVSQKRVTEFSTQLTKAWTATKSITGRRLTSGSSD